MGEELEEKQRQMRKLELCMRLAKTKNQLEKSKTLPKKVRLRARLVRTLQTLNREGFINLDELTAEVESAKSARFN